MEEFSGFSKSCSDRTLQIRVQSKGVTTFCIQSIMAFKPRFVFSKKAGTEPVKAETLRTEAQVALKETWPCLGLGFYKP